MAASFDELLAVVPADLLVGVIDAPELAFVVLDVTHDSRQVTEGWAFVCIVGASSDGHRFAADAVAAGATCLVVEHPVSLEPHAAVPQIVVSDTRTALGPLAAAVHGHPANHLRVVGITGTNGKTTTSHMLAAILRHDGIETRVIGTLSGSRTTPEAPDLHRMLADFVEQGAEAVVMEVSSHALELQRVAGMHFDVAVFTNLGRDHLDLHGSMEAYFRAKARLFTPELSTAGVTNLDDTHGRLLYDAAPIPMVGFGSADTEHLVVDVGSLSFTWRGCEVAVPIGGHVNALNALAALTAAVSFGLEPESAAAGLAETAPIPGRFEIVSDPQHDSISVVVDYAHTPDGLLELLQSARQMTDAELHVVFGCGGDRDRDKRPLMGAVAAAHADSVVVTSDNPRHEDPLAIIADVMSGVESAAQAAVTIEPDRRAAIVSALSSAEPGDLVLVVGKGHESTQTIGDTVHPFDDRTVCRAVLAELRPNRTSEPTTNDSTNDSTTR